MQYREFGRTGRTVSEVGYGMWGMGGWTGSRPASCTRRASDNPCTNAIGYPEHWTWLAAADFTPRLSGTRSRTISTTPSVIAIEAAIRSAAV